MGTQPPQRVIEAARETMRKWKIPASIQLAQWALESGWGKRLSAPFNYWGMKALNGQPAQTALTKEYFKGQWVTIQARFRSFKDEAESFDAHGKLLATAQVYAPARAQLPNVAGFAHALTGTYATDPKYGDLLMAIINGSNLTQYDRGIS